MQIISLVLASVLLGTISSATSTGIRRELTKKDLPGIPDLVRCVLNSWQSATAAQQPGILQQLLEETLGPLGFCVDLVNDNPNLDSIVDCIIANLDSNTTAAQRNEITANLLLMLLNLENLQCVIGL